MLNNHNEYNEKLTELFWNGLLEDGLYECNLTNGTTDVYILRDGSFYKTSISSGEPIELFEIMSIIRQFD